jgi:hypothetical protein
LLYLGLVVSKKGTLFSRAGLTRDAMSSVPRDILILVFAFASDNGIHRSKSSLHTGIRFASRKDKTTESYREKAAPPNPTVERFSELSDQR